MSSDLGPFLTVKNDISEFIISDDDPFSRLSDLLSTFFLEHFNEVLLNSALNDFRVLLRRTVDDRLLAGDTSLFLGEERSPMFLVGEVEVHVDGVVNLLVIDIHVL